MQPRCNPLQPNAGGEAVERAAIGSATLTAMTRPRPLLSVMPVDVLGRPKVFARNPKVAYLRMVVPAERRTGFPERPEDGCSPTQ